MLDYSLKKSEERNLFLSDLLKDKLSIDYSPQQKISMANYLLKTTEKKQTTKERYASHPILTENREKTIKKRQISLEQLTSSLENGEDGLYALIIDDKNHIMDPHKKNKIDEEDEDNIIELKTYLNVIKNLQEQAKHAVGSRKFLLKKQIIECWQQAYIIKSAFSGAVTKGKMPNQIKTMAHLKLYETITLDEKNEPHSDCLLTLFNPTHVSLLLCHYSQLKEEIEESLNADMKYLLWDLEETADHAFFDNSFLYDLLIWKIDGKSNEEINALMEDQYNIHHKPQYYSTLWRKRIPKMISEQAKKDYIWKHYAVTPNSPWKTCSTCGKTKPAHQYFYSVNSNGWYSKCKECRKKKNQKK